MVRRPEHHLGFSAEMLHPGQYLKSFSVLRRTLNKDLEHGLHLCLFYSSCRSGIVLDAEGGEVTNTNVISPSNTHLSWRKKEAKEKANVVRA